MGAKFTDTVRVAHPQHKRNARGRPACAGTAHRKVVEEDRSTEGVVVADRVTIAQVAEEAGVSAMTVSNVINGKPGASEETRRRVLQVAARLGYRPNTSARTLKSGRSGMIGVMTLDLTNQFGLEIVRGIADELAD